MNTPSPRCPPDQIVAATRALAQEADELIGRFVALRQHARELGLREFDAAMFAPMNAVIHATARIR